MTGITCWPFASPTATSLCYDRSTTCRRSRYAAIWNLPCTPNGVTRENCWRSPERRSRPTRAARRSTRISSSFIRSTVVSCTRRRFRTRKYVHVKERSSLFISLLPFHMIKWFILRFSLWFVLVPRIGIDVGTQWQTAFRGDRGARPRRMGLQVISYFDVIAARTQNNATIRDSCRSAMKQLNCSFRRRVGSLQLLSRLAVRAALTRESSVQHLPLPPRLRASVAALFANTIR